MQPRAGSASDFVLQTLRQHADRELRQGDLFAFAEGKFQSENITASLKLLLQHGLVVREKEGREAWWAISAAGLGQGAVAVQVPKPTKAAAKPPTLVIQNGRY